MNCINTHRRCSYVVGSRFFNEHQSNLIFIQLFHYLFYFKNLFRERYSFLLFFVCFSLLLPMFQCISLFGCTFECNSSNSSSRSFFFHSFSIFCSVISLLFAYSYLIILNWPPYNVHFVASINTESGTNIL